MDKTAVSPDLVNAIYHHTRINERAIGVDFDSDKVTAVYRLLEELNLEKSAKKNLEIELVLQLEEIKEMIELEKSKAAEFNRVMEIAKSSEMTMAMMEVLND